LRGITTLSVSEYIGETKIKEVHIFVLYCEHKEQIQS